MLEILYQDSHFIAINKPSGMLVHRTNIAADAQEFVLQTLKKQLGDTYLYPVHRLDRKTSGVLLLAFSAEVTAALQASMEKNEVKKRYTAIVRGWFPDHADVDHPLTNDAGKLQEARTIFRCLQRSELPLSFGKHQTSRYSLVEALPQTGRQHQIRKHLDRLRHPIIGDRVYGCNKQNRLFKEHWDMMAMLLHAQSLELLHPVNQEPIVLEAKPAAEFKRMLEVLRLLDC